MFRRPAVPNTALVMLGLATLLAGGCARTRVVTISAVPVDATIRVEGRDRGRGPLTETFTFSGDTDVYRVSAEREGYRPQVKVITPDEKRESLVIELKPTPRPVTFSVSPMPAIVKLDGKPLSDDPRTEYTADVEFRVEPGGKWTTHTVTAEREGFDTATVQLRYEDMTRVYKLDLAAKQKDLLISTVPDKAEVYFNDEFFGPSPVDRKNVPFPVDRQTGDFEPQRLRIRKPGYEEINTQISWDGGRINYDFELKPQTKDVRIVTNPPDATSVTLGKLELKRDESGAFVYKGLVFQPINEKGESLSYSGIAEKKRTADAEWSPTPFTVAWDGGQQEYTVNLKEIVVRNVPVTRVRMVRGEDGTWTAKGEDATTVGFKFLDDGAEANEATRVTRLPKATKIDTLAVSPDGSQLVYTTLSGSATDLRSQIFRQPTDGGDPVPLTDGRSLELTPAFTPDGARVVFASNRAGRKLSIWSMPAEGQPVPEQLTMGDTNDLWPSVDSNPQPRLFFQSFVDTRADPRLFSAPLGAARKRDLTAGGATPNGGTQPRVAPTADAVVFAAVDEKTNKRDIFRMSDGGLDVINLTNSPNVDEFDPTWSPDGLRVAYVSDANRAGEAADNYDVYVRDASGGGEAVRVTYNNSWDDSPAWDPRDPAIYFRSNRGGEWNIWRLALK